MTTANILDTIVERKKQEVAQRKQSIPIEKLKQNIQNSNISFFDALQGKNRVHLIAEIKFASPSQGVIVPVVETHCNASLQENMSLRLHKTIRLYNRYASAMSVLTDEKFFNGSFKNLQITRKNSHLPLLCKDFIIDEYQIYEARHYGANAILLIAAILTEKELQDFYAIATKLGMDALFEVHDEEELEKVLKVNARIIGVNNRNLKDFSINHELTKKMSTKIPKECLIVAESGISQWNEVAAIQGIADAMLVGTAIMKDTHPDAKIAELTHLPKVKICGVTNIPDALEAIKCGASAIGLIFADSPRKVSINQAKMIQDAVKLQAPEVQIVGVFVNDPNAWKTAKEVQLDAVQLHGDETKEDIQAGRKVFAGEIWKSYSVKNAIDWEKISQIPADKILLDTQSDAVRGGTGKVFDWELLKKELRINNNFQSQASNFETILSGGISPENIQKARNYASFLDVSSGVEKEKGKKDFEKMRKLFRALKA